MLDGLLWIWRTSSKSNSNEKKHTQIHGFMLVEYAKYICNMSHNFYHFTILIHNTLIYHVLPHWRNPAIWGLIKNFLWFFFILKDFAVWHVLCVHKEVARVQNREFMLWYVVRMQFFLLQFNATANFRLAKWKKIYWNEMKWECIIIHTHTHTKQ